MANIFDGFSGIVNSIGGGYWTSTSNQTTTITPTLVTNQPNQLTTGGLYQQQLTYPGPLSMPGHQHTIGGNPGWNPATITTVSTGPLGPSPYGNHYAYQLLVPSKPKVGEKISIVWTGHTWSEEREVPFDKNIPPMDASPFSLEEIESAMAEITQIENEQKEAALS